MINFDNLPLPDVLTTPTYEQVVADNVAVLQQIKPDYTMLESDPYMLLIEAFAYREMFLRVQMNNKIKSLLIPFAKNNDLDTVAVLYGVQRLDNEQDDAFRIRILNSLDAHTTAGSEESYEYHAKSVSAVIDDAHCFSPSAGNVTVAITSFEDDITADLINQVTAKLNQAKVRPITDDVTVVAATITTVNIVAQIDVFDLSDTDTLRDKISLNFEQQLKIGQGVPYSQLINNCHVEGVFKVTLTSHSADIPCAPDEILKIDLVDLSFVSAL